MLLFWKNSGIVFFKIKFCRIPEKQRISIFKILLFTPAPSYLHYCEMQLIYTSISRLANDIKSAQNGYKRQFSGLRDVYSRTFRSEGMPGLYRGFGISCSGLLVHRSCLFGLYDTLKSHLPQDDSYSLIRNLALGYGKFIVLYCIVLYCIVLYCTVLFVY